MTDITPANTQKICHLQVEIAEHISRGSRIYLKIEGSGKEKRVTVVTGLLAALYSFFGSKNYDLRRILDVYQSQVKLARNELVVGSAGNDKIEEYKKAVNSVLDLVTAHDDKLHVSNFRPFARKDVEKRADTLREKFWQAENTATAPQFEDKNLAALAKMQSGLFDPLWKFQNTKGEKFGWSFHDNKIELRERTMGGALVEAKPFSYQLLRDSLTATMREFNDTVLSSLDTIDFSSDPLSDTLQKDLREHFRGLIDEIDNAASEDETIAKAQSATNVMSMLQVLMTGVGIRIDGKKPMSPSKEDIKNQKRTQIKFVMLQFLSLIKKEYEVTESDKLKEQFQKLNQLFLRTPDFFEKTFYVQFLEIVNDFQTTSSLWQPCISRIARCGLELMVSQDKVSKAQSHFLHDDKGMPAERIHARLLREAHKLSFTDTDIQQTKVLLDAFLVRPNDPEAFRRFILLELEELRTGIKEFFNDEDKNEQLDAIELSPTKSCLQELLSILNPFPYKNKSKWDGEARDSHWAKLDRIKRGLQRDLGGVHVN